MDPTEAFSMRNILGNQETIQNPLLTAPEMKPNERFPFTGVYPLANDCATGEPIAATSATSTTSQATTPTSQPGLDGSGDICDDASEGSRRRRTLFSRRMTNRLETVFKAKNYITPQERNDIAKELGLKSNQVKIWFQNRRYKRKRLMQEQQQRGSMGGAYGIEQQQAIMMAGYPYYGAPAMQGQLSASITNLATPQQPQARMPPQPYCTSGHMQAHAHPHHPGLQTYASTTHLAYPTPTAASAPSTMPIPILSHQTPSAAAPAMPTQQMTAHLFPSSHTQDTWMPMSSPNVATHYNLPQGVNHGGPYVGMNAPQPQQPQTATIMHFPTVAPPPPNATIRQWQERS